MSLLLWLSYISIQSSQLQWPTLPIVSTLRRGLVPVLLRGLSGATTGLVLGGISSQTRYLPSAHALQSFLPVLPLEVSIGE